MPASPGPAPDAAHLHVRSGAPAGDGWRLTITPESAGWAYSGLRILELTAGGRAAFSTGGDEGIVLPLRGSAQVACDGETIDLRGRADVFSALTDFAYVPRDASVAINSASGGRFALATARTERRLPFRYGAAGDVRVELRGTGMCSREVRNLAMPDTFEAQRLIAVEVITPGGNWSSYPPHKHDEERPGEAVLEEIYYYQIAPGPGGPGMGYQRVYGTPERPIDVLAEVRTGDAIIIPHGWHGPSMAVPGYDMYYLNVMAGPGPERAWRITDDPAHAWIRDTWTSRPVDPRLTRA